MARESRLADIYRSELKNKGLLGALVSAIGERGKEKTDIRRILPQSGLTGAAFGKMFGKAYKYNDRPKSSVGSVRNVGSTVGSSGDSAVSQEVNEKLTRISTDNRITAKNTIVLPAMARDMNLTRMNIQKLVKLSGGKASTKSDMFFKRAGEREDQYESQFKKNTGTSKSATATPTAGGGGLGSLLSGLGGGMLSGIGSAISGIASSLGSIGGGILTGLGAVFGGLGIIGLVGFAVVGWIIKQFFDSIPFGKIGESFGEVGTEIGKFFKGEGDWKTFTSSLIGVGNSFALLKESITLTIDNLSRIPGDIRMNMTNLIERAAAAAAGTPLGSKTSYGEEFKKQGSNLGGSVAETAGGAATGMIAGKAFNNATTGQNATKNAVRNFQKTGKPIEEKLGKKLLEICEKIASKGWTGKVISKLIEKGFYRFAAAIGLQIAGIAAAGPTAGLSLAISVLGFAVSVWGIYDLVSTLYEIYAEIEKEENQQPLAPTKVNLAGRTGYDEAGNPMPAPTKVNLAGRTGYDEAGNPMPAPTTSPQKTTTGGVSAASSTTPTPAASSSGSIVPNTENLLNLIGNAEGGRMGYEAANKGNAGDLPGGYPGLTKMTINDVLKAQSDGKIFAAGRYQIIPKTLLGLLSGKYGSTGVKGDDLFDASTQDKLGSALINQRLKQGGGDPVKTQLALSQEFAAIADPSTGKSYYAGKGNNAASISTQQIQTALTGGNIPVASNIPSTPEVSSPKVSGGALAAASVGTASTIAFGAPTIVNAPVTNNMSSGGGGGNMAAASVYDNELAKKFFNSSIFA